MRLLLVAAVLAFAVPAEGRGESGAAIVFLGLQSPDLGAADVAQVAAAIDEELVRILPSALTHAAAHAALDRDPEIARGMADARRASEAGSAAQRAFDFPAARREFDRALSIYRRVNADRLAPVELALLHEQRAMLAYGLRKPDEVRLELARAIPLQRVKALDEKAFAPDAIALYGEELARAKDAPPATLDLATLSDLARRTGAASALVGELRAREGVLSVRLVVISSATAFSEDLDVPKREMLASAVEGGLRRVLSRARIVAPTPTPTPVAVATSRPVPPRALPTPSPVATPRDERKRGGIWYLVGGSIAVGLIFAGGMVATRRDSASDSGSGGVDVVLDPPS